jgi:hypothetical protein
MLRVVLEGLLTPNASNLQSDVSTEQSQSARHNCVPPKTTFVVAGCTIERGVFFLYMSMVHCLLSMPIHPGHAFSLGG